jgi:hypothetical protein
MKNIKHRINISLSQSKENHDFSLVKFENNSGVCSISDGKRNKGIVSNKWAEHICNTTPLTPIKTEKGLNLFMSHIWDDFYEEQVGGISDNFVKTVFEKQGSFATFAACWFQQKKNKTIYQWLSYGNSAVLVYNPKEDELFVPQYDDSLVGFLKNKGLLNWKDESVRGKYLLSGASQEFNEDSQLILATAPMAEYLAISYLIIKSKEDSYWELLSSLMTSDKALSDIIYKNRGAYSYNSFAELLEAWDTEIANKSVDSFVENLREEGMIAKGDLTLQVFLYDSKVSNFTTKHKPSKIRTKPSVVAPTIKAPKPKSVSKPKPKPKEKVSELKSNHIAYLDLLLDNNIRKLYHFTDRSNIAMIKKMGGLYSWDYMERKGFNIPKPGGDQLSRMLDQRYGLHNFVRTSFCSNHPMMYVAKNQGRIDNPIVLEIDPAIVTLKTTLFSNMNATKTGHHKGDSLSDLKKVKFDVCTQRNHFNLSDEDKPYYQAEVMVLEFIPVKYIMNLSKY